MSHTPIDFADARKFLDAWGCMVYPIPQILELAEQADKLRRQRDALRAAISPWLNEIIASVGASHLTDGFKPKRNNYDEILDRLQQAIKECE